MAGPQPWHGRGQLVEAAESPHGRKTTALRVQPCVLERALVRLVGLARSRPTLDLASESVLGQGAAAIEPAKAGRTS